MNAPRMTSSPKSCAGAAKPRSRSRAPRTRIWALESCSRRSTGPNRLQCPTSAIATPTAAARRAKPASRSSVAQTLVASPEKNSDSRTIAPKSVIEAAAMTSWPGGVPSRPVSASTGTTMPKAVAESMIATSNGALARLAARDRRRC